ncbi:hypothetical protein EDB92DRAFT_1878657 [Lactarius akahatsu]|uniref:Ubiquitin-like domain-containing protein n=1 Tax=Lactarius akahatsu TaxID=416441 RepID=A0AAD4LGN2_9AGAM|nr:hypothetical protein EDB92DRAFT_1878657 [Lactarius akahatsu]
MEIAPELWSTVSHVIDMVTITLESEISSTACDSPVSLEKALDRIVSPKSLNSSLPPLSSPHQQARRDTLHTLRQLATLGQSATLPQADSPRQSWTQKSGRAFQAVNIKFLPSTSSAPSSFIINEPGLLGKKVSYIFGLIEAKIGYSVSISELLFGISCLDNERTLSSYGIASGDTINVTLEVDRFMGKKPVIYLYPPSSLADVTVELALASSWRFSAVHPPPWTTIPPGDPHTAQCVTWTVAAEPNGMLVDKTSGMEVSYLYWEAIAKSNLVMTDTTTVIANTEAFDPSCPSVNPGDSVLLPTSKLPGYLDVVLKALTLHTEARTSFITYWLPDMLKYEYVALRFIAQESYEKAAGMRITPAPDIVTRVFMLFRGVAASDLALWEPARARAAEADGATFWADAVGVDAARAADSGLFRVLEWGGMEVR